MAIFPSRRSFAALLRTGASIAVIGATLCLAGAAHCASPDDKTLLRGVAIVNTRDGTLAPDMSILIDHGKISDIRPDGGAAPDASTIVIDARGKFVVPGYLDMHAHAFENPKETQRILTLMLANGITGWRQMSGSPKLLEERREGKLPVAPLDPELLIMPGALITPLVAGSTERAVAEVKKQKDQGTDFIKVVIANPSVFFAALGEAKQDGLPFAGHLQNGVDAALASKAGMTAIEHLGPGETLLLSCSTDEAELREKFVKSPPMQGFPFNLLYLTPFQDSLMGVIEKKIITRPSVLYGQEEIARFRRVVDSFSEEKCRQLAAVFVANGTWQVPTMIRVKTSELSDHAEFLNDPDLRYIAPDEAENWRKSEQKYLDQFNASDRQTLQDAYALRLKVVKLFDSEGVKMLAGDDVGGGIWGVPGFGLHHEFDELAQAGLTPMRILQMTTLNGAEFLGRTTSMGSVDVGKNADLVLLQANPIDSAQNLHKIDAVVRAGHYFSRQDLDGMLEKSKNH